MYDIYTLSWSIRVWTTLFRLVAFSAYLVVIWYNFVEKPEALQTVFVDLALVIEVVEIRTRGKHHPYLVVGLAVQFLKEPFLFNGYVGVGYIFKVNKKKLNPPTHTQKTVFFFNKHSNKHFF